MGTQDIERALRDLIAAAREYHPSDQFTWDIGVGVTNALGIPLSATPKGTALLGYPVDWFYGPDHPLFHSAVLRSESGSIYTFSLPSPPEPNRDLFDAWLAGRLEWRSPSTGVWTAVPAPSGTEELRVKPEPTKDSIDWDHVSLQYAAMARDEDGKVFLFHQMPVRHHSCWLVANGKAPAPGRMLPAKAFTSYQRGTCDWKDSLVLRPGVEQ